MKNKELFQRGSMELLLKCWRLGGGAKFLCKGEKEMTTPSNIGEYLLPPPHR